MRRSIGCLGPILVFLGLGINACTVVTQLSGQSRPEDLSGYSPAARAGAVATDLFLRFGLIALGLVLIVVSLLRNASRSRRLEDLTRPASPAIAHRPVPGGWPSASGWPSGTGPPGTAAAYSTAQPARRPSAWPVVVGAVLIGCLLIGAVVVLAGQVRERERTTTQAAGPSVREACGEPRADWPPARFPDAIDISPAMHLPPGARAWAPADPSALGPQQQHPRSGTVHAYVAMCLQDDRGRLFGVEAVRHDSPLVGPAGYLRKIVDAPDDDRPISTGDLTLGGAGPDGGRVLAVDRPRWLLTVRSTAPDRAAPRDLAEMLLVLNLDL